MSIDYKKYPPNWKTEIRPYILARAKNRCEFCKVKNYNVGLRGLNGRFYSGEYISEKLEKQGIDLWDDILFHTLKKDGSVKWLKIVLTVAHLDHDLTNNNYDNLKALCQKCHLNYDHKHHMKNSRITRNKKKGLQELFN